MVVDSEILAQKLHDLKIVRDTHERLGRGNRSNSEWARGVRDGLEVALAMLEDREPEVSTEPEEKEEQEETLPSGPRFSGGLVFEEDGEHD